MKTKIFSLLLLVVIFSFLKAQQDSYGYNIVNATMGQNYVNRVFVNLEKNTLISKPAKNWDIAFYRISPMTTGVRLNDAMKVDTYKISNEPSQWDKISPNDIAGEPIYNPDKTDKIQDGVFSLGDPGCSNPKYSVGYGCYNIDNHHIDGKAIYILKYSEDKYVKFMITDYFGGYTFKYTKWNGTDWGSTTTKTITNASADAYFNYYSFTTDSEVFENEPPKNEWDFMLTRYWTFYNNQLMYLLTGVIQSPNISVAMAKETQYTNEVNKPADTEFKKGITSIGDSWKSFGEALPDIVYYIKKENKYYRLYFTENGGLFNGNVFFKYKDITNQVLSTNEVNANISFGLFPNPTQDKQVTFVYDIKKSYLSTGKIEIFDMIGRKVYETNIDKSIGFFKKNIDLNNLQTGTYIVKLSFDNFSETKKLIVK